MDPEVKEKVAKPVDDSPWSPHEYAAPELDQDWRYEEDRGDSSSSDLDDESSNVT